MAHTPGPWGWVLIDGERSALKAGERFVIYVASQPGNYGLSSTDTIEVSEEDARLIKACPDMIEALIQSRDDILFPPDPDSQQRRLARLNAVISQVFDGASSVRS